ncbi:ATP-dependent DNA helicase [Ceratobasidium sp. AG-Ba]|nr:ATP-dependent DNA helicase [Ceratobasidium sp. AG-Ba]
MLSQVPKDSRNPFEHAPFTFPVFRRNMMLERLEEDDEEDIYSDTLLDVVGESSGARASDGFVLDKDAFGRLKKPEAQHLTDDALVRATKFIVDWYWPKVQSYRVARHTTIYAVERIQLAGGNNAPLDPTGRDGGWGYYRKMVQALFNRPGGLMSVVGEVMNQAGATPAHAWRQLRDENRRSVEKKPLGEYDVPLPSGSSRYMGGTVHDAIAEAIFGPEAVGSSGRADTAYVDAARVLAERMWERQFRKLRNAIGRSRDCFEVCRVAVADAQRSSTKEASDHALHAMRRWQVEAETTLEVLDVPFKALQDELRGIYNGQGYNMDEVAAGMKRRTHKKNTYNRRKKISQLASPAEMSASQANYERFCETILKSSDSEIPLRAPGNIVQLLEGDEEIGTEMHWGLSKDVLMASLGLPGMSRLPFGNEASPGSKPVELMCHQVAGICSVLAHSFTRTKGKAGLPTMICDEVGLGKTGLLIGVIQMIAHLRQQQQLSPAKKLIPPPLAMNAHTPFFEGRDEIPTLPHLVVVPRTLSNQWAGEIDKFTAKGSFQVVRYCSDQQDLARFFANPDGDYMRAAGRNGGRADRVIVLADRSAIEAEAGRCFKSLDRMGSKAARRQLARGQPSLLALKSGTILPKGNIWQQQFASVVYDESHLLRNDKVANLACLKLSSNSLVRVAATATPLFTGPKDICAQGRLLRHEAFIDDKGEELFDWMYDDVKAATKDWEENSLEVIDEAIEKDLEDLREAGYIGNQPEDAARVEGEIRCKYESDDQLKIVKTEFVNRGSIEKLRAAMLPIVLRRTGKSRDVSGQPIMSIQSYVQVTSWYRMRPMERYVVDRVSRLNKEERERRKRGEEFNLSLLKWDDFMARLKDACMWPWFVDMKEEERKLGLDAGTLVNSAADSWTLERETWRRSSRLSRLDDLLEIFWTGNPKPPSYYRDGKRNYEADDQQPDPPPLLVPRKFVIFIEFGRHRRLVKKMLELQGRKCVEYHGDMNMEQRQKAADTFKTDPECRVMLLSKVGGTGLNLQVASILIFLSPLWSGLEKRQLIGRLWRLGQLNQVIIMDIITAEGPDLVIGGHAGSKSAMSDVFLRVERDLYEAQRTWMDVQHDLRAVDDSNDEDDHGMPDPGLQMVKRSYVAPRKRKNVEPTDPQDLVLDKHDPEPEQSDRAQSKKRRVQTHLDSVPGPSSLRLLVPAATGSTALSRPALRGAAPGGSSPPQGASFGEGGPSDLHQSLERLHPGPNKTAGQPQHMSPSPSTPPRSAPAALLTRVESAGSLVAKPRRRAARFFGVRGGRAAYVPLPRTPGRYSSGSSVDPESPRSTSSGTIPPPDSTMNRQRHVATPVFSSQRSPVSSPPPPSPPSRMSSSPLPIPVSPLPAVAPAPSRAQPKPRPRPQGDLADGSIDMFNLFRPQSSKVSDSGPGLQNHQGPAEKHQQRLETKSDDGEHPAQISAQPAHAAPALPPNWTAPRASDSPIVWKEKTDALIAHKRGTVAPVRATAVVQRQTAPNTSQVNVAGPSRLAGEAGGAQPAQQHKRSGFVRRTLPTSMGATKATTKAAALSQRDSELLGSAVLRPTSRPRSSMFDQPK